MSKAVVTAAAQFIDLPDGPRVQQIMRITEKPGYRAPYLEVVVLDVERLRQTYQNYALTVFDRENDEPRRNPFLVELIESCGLDANQVLDETDWEVDEQKAVLIGKFVTANIWHETYNGVSRPKVGPTSKCDQTIAQSRLDAALAARVQPEADVEDALSEAEAALAAAGV